MASIYARRLRNARRIGLRIKSLLKQGYVIFDENGGQINRCIFQGFTGVGLSFESSEKGHVVYMDADTQYDNGMRTKIEEFNSWFAGWKAIHPQDIKTLF